MVYDIRIFAVHADVADNKIFCLGVIYFDFYDIDLNIYRYRQKNFVIGNFNRVLKVVGDEVRKNSIEVIKEVINVVIAVDSINKVRIMEKINAVRDENLVQNFVKHVEREPVLYLVVFIIKANIKEVHNIVVFYNYIENLDEEVYQIGEVDYVFIKDI